MADYNKFWPGYKVREGDYQNDKADHGNKNSLGDYVGTRTGISAPVAEKWLGYPPTIEDMQTFPIDDPQISFDARRIIEWDYWDMGQGDYINHQLLAENIIDWYAHKGVSGGGKHLQRLLNNKFNTNLTVDGKTGSATLAAINAQDPAKLHNALSNFRKDYYARTAKPIYQQGFQNRIDKYFPQITEGLKSNIPSTNAQLKHFTFEKRYYLYFALGILVLLLLGYSVNKNK